MTSVSRLLDYPEKNVSTFIRHKKQQHLKDIKTSIKENETSNKLIGKITHIKAIQIDHNQYIDDPPPLLPPNFYGDINEYHDKCCDTKPKGGLGTKQFNDPKQVVDAWNVCNDRAEFGRCLRTHKDNVFRTHYEDINAFDDNC